MGTRRDRRAAAGGGRGGGAGSPTRPQNVCPEPKSSGELGLGQNRQHRHHALTSCSQMPQGCMISSPNIEAIFSRYRVAGGGVQAVALALCLRVPRPPHHAGLAAIAQRVRRIGRTPVLKHPSILQEDEVGVGSWNRHKHWSCLRPAEVLQQLAVAHWGCSEAHACGGGGSGRRLAATHGTSQSAAFSLLQPCRCTA